MPITRASSRKKANGTVKGNDNAEEAEHTNTNENNEFANLAIQLDSQLVDSAPIFAPEIPTSCQTITPNSAPMSLPSSTAKRFRSRKETNENTTRNRTRGRKPKQQTCTSSNTTSPHSAQADFEHALSEVAEKILTNKSTDVSLESAEEHEANQQNVSTPLSKRNSIDSQSLQFFAQLAKRSNDEPAPIGVKFESTEHRMGLKGLSNTMTQIIRARKEIRFSELISVASVSSVDRKDDKRRMYDVLNVLSALRMVVKAEKSIRWLGEYSPGGQRIKVVQCRNRIAELRKRVDELEKQNMLLKALVERNRKLFPNGRFEDIFREQQYIGSLQENFVSEDISEINVDDGMNENSKNDSMNSIPSRCVTPNTNPENESSLNTPMRNSYANLNLNMHSNDGPIVTAEMSTPTSQVHSLCGYSVDSFCESSFTFTPFGIQAFPSTPSQNTLNAWANSEIPPNALNKVSNSVFEGFIIEDDPMSLYEYVSDNFQFTTVPFFIVSASPKTQISIKVTPDYRLLHIVFSDKNFKIYEFTEIVDAILECNKYEKENEREESPSTPPNTYSQKD